MSFGLRRAARAAKRASHGRFCAALYSKPAAVEEEDEEVLKQLAAVVHERSRAAAAVVTAACAAAETTATQGSGPQGEKANGNRPPFDWTAHIDDISPTVFRRLYRMDKEDFAVLLERLRPLITTANTAKARASRPGSGPISPEVRLAVTLSYLAGARVVDLLLIYKPISWTELYNSIWLTVDAINATLATEFPFDDEDKLKQIEREFRAASKHGCWHGAVGAVDGVHFTTVSPGKAVDNPRR
jgi:hypothetical protein